MRFIVVEIEGSRLLALGIDELNTVFLYEGTGLHFVEHLEALEHPVGFRNQRFADVETRKAVALEQLDLDAELGQKRGNRTARWPAADDDNVRRLADACTHEGKLLALGKREFVRITASCWRNFRAASVRHGAAKSNLRVLFDLDAQVAEHGRREEAGSIHSAGRFPPP